MMGAGKLSTRLRFEAREDVDDGAGNRLGEWKARFSLWASVWARGGGEQVLAARLGGVQPVIITTWRTEQAAGVTAAWRAVDVQTGVVYAITAPPRDPDGKRRFLEMVGTAGVAS